MSDYNPAIPLAVKTILAEYATDLGVPDEHVGEVVEETFAVFRDEQISEESARALCNHLRELAEAYTEEQP